MPIKIVYCPVEIKVRERKIEKLGKAIKEYQFKTLDEQVKEIEVEDSMPKYGSDDLSVWLHLAEHLGNQEFIDIYGNFSHEQSNKSYWRWISYLKANVIDVVEV